MSRLAFAFFCLQALLIQNVYSQCIGAGYGHGYGGIAPGYGPAVAGFAPGYAGPHGFGGPELYAPVADVVASYGGAGIGDVAVAGEMPVAGTTLVAGQVPILGIVHFAGELPAAGIVSVAGNCGCGCGNGAYIY
ncbi:chorion class CA protein ERA.5-like [Nymphalis io]|uniref:chorion class CA protein ERA.5-like n=1 Tax=Inachis io TaxID=171585 RepID=UPI002169B374|nr:chorion class CA protein ERA.5-like [Nymphalis io]